MREKSHKTVNAKVTKGQAEPKTSS